jgi:PAS domain S-box-containing protein
MTSVMDSRALLTFFTVCSAGALACAIGARARRSDLDALLLALLAAVAVWAGGVGAFLAVSDPGLQELTVRIAFLGVFAATPLWLIFTLRASRPTCLERMPYLPALIALPQALAYLALLTNSAHHGMLREGMKWTDAFAEYAGPWMLGFGVVAAAWMLAAAVVLLAWAWRLRTRTEVHRATLFALAAAGLLPVAGFAARIVVPASSVHAVFPASFIVAVLMLAAGPLRERLLRGVPLGHRDVFESLRDGVLVASPGGAIVDANPAALRLLGRELRQLLGRELADVIAELAAPERSPSLRRELEELAGNPAASVRLDVALRDGRRLEVRAARVGDGAGDSQGRYALLRDRTEEGRFAEAARRAQKLETVATLAGGVAHEVSNPLAFVRANLAEIDRLGALAERHLEAGRSELASELADLSGLAKEALEGIARIERIAAGMRRLSTANEGFADVELGPVVDEAVQLARIRFARPLDVDLQIDPHLPSVRGAPALLVQALLHLIVAAQRGASARGCAIRVRGERAGEAVVVRIGCQDGSAGAVETDASSRADDPGLPIARDIARDHGGELEIDGSAAAPTALALRLPLAEGAA